MHDPIVDKSGLGVRRGNLALGPATLERPSADRAKGLCRRDMPSSTREQDRPSDVSARFPHSAARSSVLACWLRRPGMKRLAFVLAASGAAYACSVAPKLCPTLMPEPAYSADTVQISFLGVGGLIIRWQGEAIMTTPLYSNPTIGEMALSEIHVDRQRIDELMRGGLHDVTNVRAILAGHSHYDHLMEAPYIALHRAQTAEILGNDAMVKLLDPIARDLSPRSLVSLERLGPNAYHDVPGTRFRIYSIISQHSPQLGTNLFHGMITIPSVTLWRGEDEQVSRELPVRVGRWMGGTTLAFVIELREPGSDKVAFRIYYQDSSTLQPYGYPAQDGATLKYDLAILCMGGATEYPAFPGDIVKYLKPQYVMGIHWEDFFTPRPLPTPNAINATEKIHYAPGVSERGFLKAVKAAQESGGRAIVPCPDKTTIFSRTTGAWLLPPGDGDWGKPRP
jgi:hypothetical protein